SETVARDNVEPGPGQQHDVALPCFRVPSEDRFEDLDLAGDVEIMRARSEAGVHHRAAGRGERSGAVEDEPDVAQVGTLERERPPGQSEFFGERADLRGVATGEDGLF